MALAMGRSPFLGGIRAAYVALDDTLAAKWAETKENFTHLFPLRGVELPAA